MQDGFYSKDGKQPKKSLGIFVVHRRELELEHDTQAAVLSLVDLHQQQEGIE